MPKSFDETVKTIDTLNSWIIPAMSIRRKYPICREYFTNTPQRDLKALGIDSWAWSSEYLPILEMICDDGEVKNEQLKDMLSAESWLERLLLERLIIAEKVIEYKAPRGLEITRKDREEGIITEMRQLGGSYGMNPDSVERVYRRLISRSKDVQNCILNSRGFQNGFEIVEECKTMQPLPYVSGDNGSVEGIKRRFKIQGEMLAQKDGMKYWTVVEETKARGNVNLPHYAIRLLREKV